MEGRLGEVSQGKSVSYMNGYVTNYDMYLPFISNPSSTLLSMTRFVHSHSPFQVLFELARFHAPSTIFMDELESIMGQRSGFGAPGYVLLVCSCTPLFTIHIEGGGDISKQHVLFFFPPQEIKQ